MKFRNIKISKYQTGVAALPTILILGGIITELAIAAIIGGYLLINLELGNRLSEEAFSAAKSGVEDALLKIVRDRSFNNNFSLAVGNNSATVTICKDICVGVGKYKITAAGQAQSRHRQLEAIVVVDDTTGGVALESLTEVPL